MRARQVIELLTGSPPYYDLAPAAALFRIVQASSNTHPNNRKIFFYRPRRVA